MRIFNSPFLAFLGVLYGRQAAEDEHERGEAETLIVREAAAPADFPPSRLLVDSFSVSSVGVPRRLGG
jgi:hypothetical protein